LFSPFQRTLYKKKKDVKGQQITIIIPQHLVEVKKQTKEESRPLQRPQKTKRTMIAMFFPD